jgi:hypothetical protein
VEKVAREQARELLSKLTGCSRMPSEGQRRRHPIAYPPATVLARGDMLALNRFRKGTMQCHLAAIAWNSLASGGKFAGRATRADMTRYLMSYEQFKNERPAAVSGAISAMLKRGLLVVSQED